MYSWSAGNLLPRFHEMWHVKRSRQPLCWIIFVEQEGNQNAVKWKCQSWSGICLLEDAPKEQANNALSNFIRPFHYKWDILEEANFCLIKSWWTTSEFLVPPPPSTHKKYIQDTFEKEGPKRLPFCEKRVKQLPDGYHFGSLFSLSMICRTPSKKELP